MKNEKKTVIYKISYILGGLIFLAGILLILLFPFQNRSLECEIMTTDGIYRQQIGRAAVSDGSCGRIALDIEENVEIQKLKYYGSLRSILLKELNYGEFAAYVENVENGGLAWTDTGIQITGDGTTVIYMNDAYIAMIQSLSSTFLQERLILIELWIALCGIFLLIASAIREKREKDSRNNHGPIFEMRKFMADIKRYGQYMVYAANTDLKAEVANSYLNRLWWLLEPFFNMIVYVVVFGGIMGNSIKNYATFVYSALLMWTLFNKSINYSVKLVRNNKDIITKVYIPKFVILLSNMILNIFKLLFSLIVLVIMMLIFRVQIGINILWVLPAYAVILLLAFGLGMIFLHFGVYVDDLSYAVGILLNMLMFLSGIFYDVMTTLRNPLNGIILCLNPVALAVDTMRNALLYDTAANIPLIGVWLLISVLLCYLGIHIVYKNENGYVKIV